MPKFTVNINWEEGSIEEFERVYGKLVTSAQLDPSYQAPPPPGSYARLPGSPAPATSMAPQIAMSGYTSTSSPHQYSPETQLLMEAIAQFKQVVQQQQQSAFAPSTVNPSTLSHPSTINQSAPQPLSTLPTNSQEYLEALESMSPTEIERLYAQPTEITSPRSRRNGTIETWLGRQPLLVMAGIYLSIILLSLAALLQHPTIRSAVQATLSSSPTSEEAKSKPKPSPKPQKEAPPPAPDVIPAPPPP